MSFAWLVSTVVYLVVVLRTDWKTQIVISKDVKKGERGDGEEEGVGFERDIGTGIV